MPTYDYVCEACGQRVEVMHGVHADGPTSCDACGGRVRKALSTPTIVFKGSGWAKLDARNRSASAASAEKGSSEKSDGTADSKQAPTPDKAASSAAPGAEKPSSPSSATATAD